MLKREYIILRNTSRKDLRDAFSGPLRMKKSQFDDFSFQLETGVLSNVEIQKVRIDPEVMAIAPSIPAKLVNPMSQQDVAPTELSGKTWGVEATGADRSPYTGRGVKVAVLDTGIDKVHPAFQGVTIEENDFSGEGNGDRHGHGTHCAGTILGRVVNGFRFGIAPGINNALIGKIFDVKGNGNTQKIYQAIQWAFDKGADIISMSLGLDFPGMVEDYVKQGTPVDLATSYALEGYLTNVRLFESLAELARTRGAFFQSTLMVAAAGNESKRNVDPNYEISVSPPACADGIVSVGAAEAVKSPAGKIKIAYFSNTGPNVCAPGVDVISAKSGGGFTKMSGTSMATPHTAGIAALWIEKIKQDGGRLSHTELVARLIGSATKAKFVPGLDAKDVGAGLVQAPV